MGRRSWVLATLVAVALMGAMNVQAQQPGRPGFGGRGPGGGMRGGGAPDLTTTMVGLLEVKKVQEDADVLPEQVEDIKKYLESRTANRPQFDFREFRSLSEDERQKRIEEMQKDREKRAKELKAKLGEFLLPHQLDRLQEISIQLMGMRALQVPEVAEKLKLTTEQKEKLESVRREIFEQMFARRGEGAPGGAGQDGGDRGRGNFDREAMQKRMEEIQKEIESKTMAVLTSEQKATWEKMKGKPIELTDEDREAMRGGFGRGGRTGGFGGRGGRGAPGGGGRGGDGGGRPQRPAGNDAP